MLFIITAHDCIKRFGIWYGPPARRLFGSALFLTVHIVTHPLDISSGELQVNTAIKYARTTFRH